MIIQGDRFASRKPYDRYELTVACLDGSVQYRYCTRFKQFNDGRLGLAREAKTFHGIARAAKTAPIEIILRVRDMLA